MMAPGVSDLPRLLFCCFDVIPGPSAISRRLTEYLKGLAERFQVVCLTVKTPDHPHIEKYHGARLLRVPVGSGDLTAQIQAFDRAVRRQLESQEYVLVHFFDPFGGYALAEKHAELGYKLVYDASVFPSVDLPDAHPGGADDRRLIARARRQELFCLMNSDAVVVSSPMTRDWVASLGVERERVHVLRAPIDLTPYVPQVMGTPDAMPMKLIHVGSLAGNHGLPLLLEALERANQTTAVSLTIVGPPHAAWRARLEDQLSGLDLAGRVDFQAPVPHDDLHKVLATADVGALSTDNGQRNTVVGAPLSRLGEYLAAGRPVIAADVPSVRALAPDDVVVWYEAGDYVSLSDAILSLATDPVRRVQLGRKAREAASKWDAMLIRADLIALYTAITGTVAPRLGEDNELHDPNEVTQMGNKAPFTKDDSAPGTNKVHVAAGTDPAAAGLEGSTDVNEALRGSDRWEGRHRPSVMGVPIREDEPVVAGVELPPPVPSSPRVTAALVREVPDAGSTADHLLRDFDVGAASELNRTRPSPPVQRDAPPMPEGDEPLTPPTTQASFPPFSAFSPPFPATEAVPPQVSAKEALLPRWSPPRMFALLEMPPAPEPNQTTAPSLAPVSSSSSGSLPVVSATTPVPMLNPLSPSGQHQHPPARTGSGGAPRVTSALTPPPLPTRSGTSGLHPQTPTEQRTALPSSSAEKDLLVDEVLEIGDGEVEALDEAALPDPLEEPLEVAIDEAVMTVDSDASPPASAINPWLAQLVHGYCPPGSDLFNRPVPPTTMPGRD